MRVAVNLLVRMMQNVDGYLLTANTAWSFPVLYIASRTVLLSVWPFYLKVTIIILL